MRVTGPTNHRFAHRLGIPVVKALSRLAHRAVPDRVQRALLAPVLNHALLHPRTEGGFDFLEGRAVRLRIEDLGVDWVLTVRAGRLAALDRTHPEDVRISGRAAAFASLAKRQTDPDTLFFQRHLRVEGDTEIGLGVKNRLDAMDWDDLPRPIRHLLHALP